ncbi:hypothetical protein J525_2300 [Acinetobacter sp. 21871]|nr:hypothetical protein J525_3745 [Acinetobacter sp. 21871]EXB68409.1 hypothetical protein J525_2300 [Acinetobacter sp. 21871]EXR61327.1 hypothetical protein J678_2797 [Acinetobacter sp. 1424608]
MLQVAAFMLNRSLKKFAYRVGIARPVANVFTSNLKKLIPQK